MNLRTPAIVLGGTGYVAGELLRLLATHPYFDLAAVASDSQPDEPVAQFFRHLQPVLPHLRFAAHDEIAEYVTANPVDGGVLRGAARRLGGVDRSAADDRGAGRHHGTCRRYLGGLPLHERRRVRRRLQACARRAGTHR